MASVLGRVRRSSGSDHSSVSDDWVEVEAGDKIESPTKTWEAVADRWVRVSASRKANASAEEAKVELPSFEARLGGGV